MFTVKEVFLTQQGEGANIGRTAVFVRFSGCNLWSGREQDRKTAVCQFCDTDFVGGFRCDEKELVQKIDDEWRGLPAPFKMVVITGGEPGLQITESFVEKLKLNGYYVAIETNGTCDLPKNIDWICVSPKNNTKIRITKAQEVKVVYPQGNLDPRQYESIDAVYYWISPMDSIRRVENTLQSVDFCTKNPKWRLAVQAHKTWSIR